MAYTTVDKVNANLGIHAVTASTPVTTSDVTDQIIPGIEAQIDAILDAQGIATLPVSSSSTPFYTYVQTVATWGATAETMKAIFPQTNDGEGRPWSDFFERRYTDALKAWRMGKDIPSTLEGGSNDVVPESFFTENPDTLPTMGALEGAYAFTMEREF